MIAKSFDLTFEQELKHKIKMRNLKLVVIV